MRSTSLCASEYLRLSTNHLEHRSNVVAPQRVRFFSFYKTGSLTGWNGGEGRGREGERRPRAGRQTVEHGANPWQPQKSNNLNTKSFRIGCKKFQIKNLDTGLCPNSYLKLWNNFCWKLFLFKKLEPHSTKNVWIWTPGSATLSNNYW